MLLLEWVSVKYYEQNPQGYYKEHGEYHNKSVLVIRFPMFVVAEWVLAHKYIFERITTSITTTAPMPINTSSLLLRIMRRMFIAYLSFLKSL